MSSGGFTPTVAGHNTNLVGGGGSGGIGGWLSSLLSNPSALLAGGGLIADILKGSSNPPGYDQILGQAKDMGVQGKQLQGYLNSGTLPPGLQTSLNSARSDAEASVRSQYASRGMSGSSAEAQDLQGVANRTVSQGADMAMKLFSMGMTENEISAQLYGVIMQEQIQQDADLSSGIANMVGALASIAGPIAAVI